MTTCQTSPSSRIYGERWLDVEKAAGIPVPDEAYETLDSIVRRSQRRIESHPNPHRQLRRIYQMITAPEERGGFGFQYPRYPRELTTGASFAMALTTRRAVCRDMTG